jgi:two-component system LytT family sensor kinase
VSRPLTPGRFEPAQLLGLWAFFSVCFAAQLRISGATTAWLLLLIGGSTRGLLWTGLAVVVLTVTRRWPLTRSRLTVPLLLYVFLLVTCMSADAMLAGIHHLAAGGSATAAAINRVVHEAVASGLPLYGVLVGIGIVQHARSVTLEAELRVARAERAATEARLHALSAQLSPHFLFNTLNTVAMAIRRADRKEALSIVLDLASLLRAVLQPDAAGLVLLAREIELVRRYLAIEQTRFRDRLEVVWDVDPATEALLVPGFLLQPVVENALRHGIGRRSEAGRLEVQTRTDGSKLTIEVRDDGNGFADGWIEGVGLRNVRARLALHYASDAALTVANSATGVVVTLVLPCQPAPDA